MRRSIVRYALTLGVLCFSLAIGFVAAFAEASAQSAGVTQITGAVVDAQHRPVDSAQVHLFGAAQKSTVTAADGSFVFLNLPAGTYRLDITKAGFDPATQEGIVAGAGATTNLSFTMQAASLTSLTIIGNVSVTSRTGANSINTTPASIADVPASTFIDQGQLSVDQVLNEIPGITIGVSSINNNGASPMQCDSPSIRGGLAYETESLIDGHAISLGQNGYFSPSTISTYLLQNVEVVKGPGATSPSINYAINGTVNYRTLEPTAKPQASADFGLDQYGGNLVNLRATGTLPGGHWAYAFDYVTQGTQGFQRGYNPLGLPAFVSSPILVNGTPINYLYGQSTVGGPAGILGSTNTYTPLVMCCPQQPMKYAQRNELGKIRYAFTPATTLTVTYLGSQSIGDGWNTIAFPCGSFNYIFAPPAGYTGSVPAGPIPNAIQVGFDSNNLEYIDTNLFETEFHTPIGNTATLQLRQYSTSIQYFRGGPGDSGPTAAGTTSITGALYGCVYFGASNTTTPTIFNGQVATMTNAGYYEVRSYNELNGYTAEIDKQAGEDLLSLSYDEEKTSTSQFVDGWGNYTTCVPGGSSQTFQSIMGRAQFELGQRVNGTLSDNFGSYTDVYTPDGGLTFQSTTHTYQAPRLSMTWRPNANESVRASAGFSIAPPYIKLLNNNAVAVLNGGATGSGGALYYTETAPGGDVLPETAFGFDLGLDTRLHSPYTVLSVDAYQTLLHNQFLQATSLDGTFTCQVNATNCEDDGHPGVNAPLYLTKTANLGHSEYEGLELSLHRSPPTGWGYRIQGSLQRAFVYDLPAGFYNTPAGPCTANLGILPNINFQATGEYYNAMSNSRVPYSTGYGEINYRGHNGAYFLAGITYYGSNNAYGVPAFGIVTTSFSQPLTKRASLQLSIYNLTNAYPGLLGTFLEGPGGVYTPLKNGLLGSFYQNVVGPSIARLTLHVDM